MTDRPPTDQGQTPNSRRLSVRHAAQELATTPDGIRARIRRGTLYGEKVGAEWVVILPPASPATDRETDPQQSETVGRPAADSRGQPPDSRATDALIAHMEREIAYLRDLVHERDRALEERSRELATERERSDVLQQLALSRIPAVSAGEPVSVHQETADEGYEPEMANDPFPANGAPQRPTDDQTQAWADLAQQLIEELGMAPAAARLAAAQELGLAG